MAVESNHTALGHGIKLYTDAMRRLVKGRLIGAYGQNWWQMGVLNALTDNQRSGLERHGPAHGKAQIDRLDTGQFTRVVTRNFDQAFASVFGDFRKTQALLMQVESARNDWAHPLSGDMPADEVGHALYAMAQLLSAAQLSEAAEVERLRKDVLQIETGPRAIGVSAVRRPTVAPGAVAAPAGRLPYWWQVCEPHDAFTDPATIDESLFAATLGMVHAGTARREYMDPALFLGQTYFTENLKQIIRDVVSRLNRGDGPSVTEVQTPFGGGKTHALLALYHLIKSPAVALAVPGVSEALGDVKVPADAKVLVFDGQQRGTDPIDKEDGSSVCTMWGELAYQADSALYQRYVMQIDGRGEAPGNEVFRKVLEGAAPCLILIDELVSYLVKLRFSSVRRNQNLYRQTVQFLQEMLQLAGNVPGVCVLLSLPKSQVEFGGIDPEQLQRELAVTDDLVARANRVASKRTPVNDDEIYTLMSKRLFKTVDRAAAERIARAYQDVYAQSKAIYDPIVFTADYRAQQVASYPLHPELIDVLYKKWSTAGSIPRTRAVLQLVANIVADQWSDRRERYAIQSAHVNLERERIRTRVVSAAGEPGYDAVVAADIIGGDAHADALDERRGGDFASFHIARGVATTLLMHSFGGRAQPGALPWELQLGTVAPNIGPSYVTEVVATLEHSLWYVHREGELLRFYTRPNVYRIIAQTAESQPEPTVNEQLRATVEKAAEAAQGFKVLAWAAGDGQLPNRPDLTIAVLDPRYAVADDSGRLRKREPIDQLWERAGGGLREWRNALILVAPDEELWQRARDAMREVMAYDAVISTVEKGTKALEVSANELRDLRSRARDKRDSLRTSVVTAYRWVFHPDEQGLTPISLAVPATRGETIAARAVDRLVDQNYGAPKVLLRMGAVYFSSKIAPRVWKDDASALELGELARRFLQWSYLPILPARDDTLRACVREGLGDGTWAVAIGDNATGTYQRLIEKPEEIDTVDDLFDGSASLVKGDLLEIIRDELGLKKRPGPEPGPGPGPDPGPGAGTGPRPNPGIPRPPTRLTRVRLNVSGLAVAKTANLQPYLFKVLQEQDPGAQLTLSIDVSSVGGVAIDALDKRIVQGLEQLGITVTWE